MSSKLQPDWDAHHDRIKELYLHQDMGLGKVRTEMEQRHGFVASKSQYETQFKNWQWRKNLTDDEWKYAGRTLKKRETENKESEVLFKGVILSKAKVEKEIPRHFLPPYLKTPPASQCLIIRTPRPILAIEVEEPITQVDQLMENRKRQRSEHPEEQPSSKIICNSRQRDKDRQNHLAHHRTGLNRRITKLKLPYLEFVDYITELNSEINSQPLLQGVFFDAPSPWVFPTILSQEFDDSHWSLTDDNDGVLTVGVSEDSLSQRNGNFYESFANLLIDPRQGITEGYFDRYDANLELQRQLPGLLANMPEKAPGEIESNIDTLLGPPQSSAGICLLQVVVYLYSNGHLMVDDSNRVMEWIVDKIPLSNLITILRTKLPTLQEFQSRLLLFAIKSNLITIVKELLNLDGWMREKALSQEYLFAAMKCLGLEMTELILSSPTGDMKKMVFGSSEYKHPDWRRIGNYITTEAAQILHREGIDLSAKDCNGETLLFYATRRGDVNLVQFLSSKEVGCPTHGDEELIDYLVLAVWCDQVEVVHFFLEHQFPVNGMIEWNYSQRRFIRDAHLSVLDLSATALQVAAFIGNIDIVEELVHFGANVNEPACGLNGMTALQAAVEFNHASVVEILLQKGAAVNALGNTFTGQPRTALLAAIENNNISIFDLLLNHNADPNVPVVSEYGTSILEVATVQKESSIFVPSLLARGAIDNFELDPQFKARSMTLQLERAVFENDLRAVQEVVAHGVTVDLHPIEFRWSTHPGVKYKLWKQYFWIEDTTTILHLALTTMKRYPNTDSSIFKYLVKHIVDINQPNCSVTPILQKVVIDDNVELVNVLLDAGVSIDFVWNTPGGVGVYGFDVTALMTAIGKENLDMVVLLLERGADINLTTEKYFTPVQFSAIHHLPEITRLLLSRGADFTTSAKYLGRFCACIVIQASKSSFSMSVVKDILPKMGIDEMNDGLFSAAETGDLGLVTLFLENGANIDTIDTFLGYSSEVTVLGLAAMRGHNKIAELLLSRGADINFRVDSCVLETALEWAALRGRLDMVQLLLNHGADSDLPLVDRYKSAQRLAKDNYHYGIVMILEKYIKEAWEEWNQLRMLEMI